MRKVKIKFHGFLGDLIPEVIEGSFETLHDILMYLSNKYPQLKAPLDIGRYAVKVDNYNTRESVFCKLFTDEIHIRPAGLFSKSAGTGQMIVAAILLVIAVTLDCLGGGGAFTTATGSSLGPWMAAAYTSAAIMMISGTLTYMLTPKIKNKGDNTAGDNKYLGTPGNTTANGTPISIGYGRYKVYGHFLSYNVSSSSVVIGAPEVE